MSAAAIVTGFVLLAVMLSAVNTQTTGSQLLAADDDEDRSPEYCHRHRKHCGTQH